MKIQKIITVILICFGISCMCGCNNKATDNDNSKSNEVIELDGNDELKEKNKVNKEENNENIENKDSSEDDDGELETDTNEKDDNKSDSENNIKEDIEKDALSGESTKENKKDNKKGNTNGNSPFEEHGKLTVKGTRLTDQNGNAFQIQGVSTHGLSWYPEYVNPDSFKSLRDDWGVNCIRLAMYTGEGGYCTGANQIELSKLIDSGISYASALGMYVIIDWHILSDNDPNTYKDEAIEFFGQMSSRYAENDNVLYEICNEPNGETSWSDIKKYAMEVIPVIKNNNKDAIIIVGTPTWSQDVDKAAADPIAGYSNIMYTLHFYADTHKDSLRTKMTDALKKGMPIFVTEFGICDASGNGSINIDEANKWIELMNKNGVGYCIWNLSNKAEASALINSNCTKKSGWTNDDLSEEGRWYLGVLGSALDSNSGSDTQGTSKKLPNNDDNNSSPGTEDKKIADSVSITKNSKSYDKNGMKVTVAPSGNWNDGSKDYYQYTITLKAQDNDISNWKIKIEFNNSVEIDQNWSANYKINDSKTIEITPVDYNTNIKKGEKAEIGFIVKSDAELEITKIIVN